MATDFSYLCFTLTSLGRTQSRLFRLHEEFDVPAQELADIFDLPLNAVIHSLIRARRRYEKTRRLIGGLDKKS